MDHIPQKHPFSPISLKIPIFQYLNINKKRRKNKLAETHHKSSPSHSCEVMKFGGASFVCRHTRESISYPPPKGRKSISSPIYLSDAVFALSPAGTDLLLIVTISIIINKLTMINIATASRSDIIIIVRLLLLLLYPHK